MTCLCTDCKSPNTTKACFKDLWLFDHFTDDQLLELKKIGLRRDIEAGAPVFRQGEPANEMFLLKAGRIKLTKVQEDGSEVTLDFRKAGDVIGEHLFSEEENYPISAWTMEETTTCGFDLRNFHSLILERPDIGMNVIKSMSNKISAMTDRFESIAENSLEDRLYSVLSNIAREHGYKAEQGYELPFRLTHEELAFLVGAHRVSITRAMQALSRCGKLVNQNKTIRLPNFQP